jgi:small subunit ribosomal protein S9
MVPKKKSTTIQKTGKRKSAIASAVLKPGKGTIRINGYPLTKFSNELARSRIKEPIILAGETAAKFDIDVKVQGGGWQGQSDATRLAIGRVLVEADKTLKKTFLGYDRQLVVADVRRKEKCKPNDSKARSKRQKSYR